MLEVVHIPTEAELKDLLKADGLKAIKNLRAYQAETKDWRDKKVKGKTLEVGDLVLL
jgi:hypothetical protein